MTFFLPEWVYIEDVSERLYMKRFFLILTLSTALFAFSFPGYEAKAIDPVTVAILTPIAIQLTRVVLPRLLGGLAAMGHRTIKAGIELFHIFRLPYGLGLCCFLRWRSGLRHMLMGSIAPFKMAFHIVMIPISGVASVF